MERRGLDVIVIGGGHAGVEAAWAAANLLPGRARVGLVTLDPWCIGVMSCNPAIGGLAKGQMVREIDALGGLMGLATDATGIQFKVLNTGKGPAVHGPRAQCDKHAYAECVQRMIASRAEIEVFAGSVERLLVRDGAVFGVELAATPPPTPTPTPGPNSAAALASGRSAARAPWPAPPVGEPAPAWDRCATWAGASGPMVLEARAVVLTTGTFMRGLMHTGERRVPGGRYGESAAVGISGSLRDLGFELGRLKTGTPPRLVRSSLDWDALEPALGDTRPTPFSDLSGRGGAATGPAGAEVYPSLARFPVLEQVDCRATDTNGAIHELIRANLHRAPMYSGQIESIGPRYCPSIEDKVVRFADRPAHRVYLEPESLRDDWIYANGISTSLPEDVQLEMVRRLPGCARARLHRAGYAVEYDFVRPHQIHADAMTKLVDGLFLAGQINGTSGYEEAAAQGVVAGINAARWARGEATITLGRDEAYIGVLMDDLVTKTPTEPYRMFTSRAEHRLTLRADNAADRLTPRARALGVLASTALGRARAAWFDERAVQLQALRGLTERLRLDGRPLADRLRRPDFSIGDLAAAIEARTGPRPWLPGVFETVHAEGFYRFYEVRMRAEQARRAAMEHRPIPAGVDFRAMVHLRTEAREALARFTPRTFGQAARLEGVTPADVTLLAVLLGRRV